MLVPIESIDDPRLAPYRDLTTKNLTRVSGLLIAEGEKVAARLIDSHFETVSVLAEPALAAQYEARLKPDVPIFVVSQNQMTAIAGFHFHRGVLACGRRQPLTSVAALNLSASEANQTVVICPDVQDPTNLGSIIRTAAAFGCAAVILGRASADPFSRRVLRVSMGAALQVPILESHDLPQDITSLRTARFEVIAAVLDSSAEPLSRFQRSRRAALVLGSEGHGLSADWLALADRRVTIPMQLGIDSLNVAVAAAVLLYELAGADRATRRLL
jgi:tRNA G18 (ribose-2'-O)-methylase SpoU